MASNNTMYIDIVARDSASGAFKEAGDSAGKMSDNMTQAGDAADTAGNKVETAADKAEAAGTKFNESALNIVTGFSGLTLAGFSLYKAWDSIEVKQRALDNANKAMQNATNGVTGAQDALNQAISKYGADSPQAEAAARALENAQNSLAVAANGAENAQKAVNDAQTTAYLTTLPTLITGLKSAKDLYDGIVGVGPNVVKALGDMDTAQGIASSSAFKLAAGAGAFATIYAAFTTDSEEIRIAMSLLAGALVTASIAQWALNAAQAAGITLTTLGAGALLVGVALASAGAIYAGATMFGATAMASGGIVPAGSNVLAMIGEGRNDEAVIPLPRGYNANSLGTALGGNVTVVHEWHVTSTRADAGEVAQEMYALMQRKGGIRP
jgi:hypothetical protein